MIREDYVYNKYDDTAVDVGLNDDVQDDDVDLNLKQFYIIVREYSALCNSILRNHIITGDTNLFRLTEPTNVKAEYNGSW